MESLIAFLFTVLLSFWGSLQLGLVNVKVIQTALSHGWKDARLVALGGCLPEIFYAGLALFAAEEIMQHKKLIEIFGYLMIPVFVALGIYYLNAKPASINPDAKPAGFKTGFMLGMVNPQLILYWTLMFLYLGKWIAEDSFITKVLLPLGAAAGAFVALWMFAVLAVRKREWLLVKSGYQFEKLIGILFISLAIWETASKFF